MTLIIAYKFKDSVIVGADSGGASDTEITIRADKKIFRVGEFVIAGTSSFRMLQLLQYEFKPPAILQEDREDMLRYMCTKFVDAVRELFANKGYMQKGDRGDDWGGRFIVAYRNRIFCIQEDYQVEETVEEYAVEGGGMYHAKGALELINIWHQKLNNNVQPEHLISLTAPEDMLETVFNACNKHYIFMSPPYHYLTTQNTVQQ